MMVAYSFQPRFVAPILAGTKCQTIRGQRRRHALPGEEMQLFTGMRTRSCKLIARVTCESLCPVKLTFGYLPSADSIAIERAYNEPKTIRYDIDPVGCVEFAERDGFSCWEDLKKFWLHNYPGIETFEGVLIRWKGDRA